MGAAAMWLAPMALVDTKLNTAKGWYLDRS